MTASKKSTIESIRKSTTNIHKSPKKPENPTINIESIKHKVRPSPEITTEFLGEVSDPAAALAQRLVDEKMGFMLGMVTVSSQQVAAFLHEHL